MAMVSVGMVVVFIITVIPFDRSSLRAPMQLSQDEPGIIQDGARTEQETPSA